MNHNNSQSKTESFKTIGEVSSELNLPPHVLRFWESKFLNIKPHKRRGGHRYYSAEDLNVIKEIKSLLYEKGYTIKGAQKFLKQKKNSIAENDDQQNLFVLSNSEADENKTSNTAQEIEAKAVKVFIKKLEDVRDFLTDIKNI